jgi:anti-anti-sigma regulatory factor
MVNFIEDPVILENLIFSTHKNNPCILTLSGKITLGDLPVLITKILAEKSIILDMKDIVLIEKSCANMLVHAADTVEIKIWNANKQVKKMFKNSHIKFEP